MTRAVRIAVVAGDGIGPEVCAAALPLMERAAALDGAHGACTELDWGGERLLRTGDAMPEDALEVARAHDAVFFGAAAVGGVLDDELRAAAPSIGAREG